MIKINAVGDVFLGDYTVSLGFGVRSCIKKYGNDHVFMHIKEYLSEGDIVFGNLETVLSKSGEDVSNIISVICRGEEEFVNILKRGGFNAVNIANNHILHHGREAFKSTIDLLKQNDIDVVGMKSEYGSGCKPVSKIIQGKKVCFLGYSFVNENYYKGVPLYTYGNKSVILNDINEYKAVNDFVIVSCHWGIEYIKKPSLNIKRLAREMVDAGASIIIGHHPHVVQGIERYNNSLIFYSLGNFLFDSFWSRSTKESMIVKIMLHDKAIEYTIIPVYINKYCQVLPMEANKSIEFVSNMETISKEIGKDNLFDVEDLHYRYYIQASRASLIIQIQKSVYILKNIFRLDRRFLNYIVRKMISVFN